MTNLPITRMTLYKHGVGFFERRAEVDTETIELSFRVEEMNDILKSLTAIDWGGGQVLGIDYATPQTKAERLAGCSVRLADDRSLQDLLTSLRGRQVTLHLDQGEALTGALLGLDEVPERQPLSSALVSVLRHGSDQVGVVALERVQSVEILDERGAGDLRFFLDTALSQEAYRSVTIRLTPRTHDLSVSYIAPAPTWRVSYRLVAEPDEVPANDPKRSGRALVQGWGIFDNRLEEDLKDISLSLVAGMPISFIYDLYTPVTPERPVIEEEGRVAAGPVGFAAAMDFAGAEPEAMPPAPAAMRSMAMAPGRAKAAARRLDIEAMQQAAVVETESADLGELFQYTIGTPVTVSRGHSAMVPIIQATMPYGKALIYNGRKMPTHPVATLRLTNETGLTLERGPVTVLEAGDYTGEAVLPFTVAGSEIVVPYAVELGMKVQERNGSVREDRALKIRGAFLQVEQWDIRWREYQLNNTTSEPITVLIEHAREPRYELFDTQKPKESTADELRFEVIVPSQGETTLRVQGRRPTHRREELKRQSYAGLQQYLKQGLLKNQDLTKLNYLLSLWEQIDDRESDLKRIEKERAKVYKAQQQIQGNMQALGQTGKEGRLRAQYVDQLEATEGTLRELASKEEKTKREIARLKAEVEARLKGL